MHKQELLYSINSLFRLSRKDPQYAEISEKYRQLEDDFGRITQKLTNEEQDIAWGFICTSDTMNWRMLEIICEKFDITPQRLDETVGKQI